MSKKLGHIAYNKLDGKKPGIVFMGGFRSDMEGSKAIFLENLCKELGLSFVRFDYSGHGKSNGKFEEGTIGQWKDDAIKVIDELTEGKQILIGSSMGGWIALLAAIARPKQTKAIIGIAAAPDFTEDLLWESFDEFTQKKLERDGLVNIPNCYEEYDDYPITMNLIEEGRKHLLLRDDENLLVENSVKIKCPIRLLHGMEDEDVPFETTEWIAKAVMSEDVEVHIVKNSGHRFSDEKNLKLLKQTLLDIINP